MIFAQARNYTKGRRASVSMIVLHTAECGERPGAARNVAAYFAGASAPQASAHYVVDSIDTIQCVHDTDIAWHAGPVNGCSIGVEHAGRAGQTEEEWADAYSLAVLARSAELVASLCYAYDIPAVWLDDAAIARGERRGICGHVDVTRGMHWGTHWDPGPHFPRARYLELVTRELARIHAAEAPTLPELPLTRDGSGL